MNDPANRALTPTSQDESRLVSVEAQLLARESLRRMSTPSPLEELKLRLIGTEAQQSQRAKLKGELVENAAWTNSQMAALAAKTASLAIDCQADISRQRLLIEHRRAMEQLEVVAQESLVRSVVGVLEQKSQLLAKVDSLEADPQIKEFAKQLIDQVHLASAQRQIDRNQPRRENDALADGL